MPVALERKLKAKVADKKMSKDRKDAYVYGTLRKTGWKPEREKKMSNTQKLIRLSEINRGVDSLIQFKDRDWTDTGADVAAGGALALGGVGTYKLHKAIQGAGGYRASAQQAGMGYDLGKTVGSGKVGLGETAKSFAGAFKESPGGAVGGALGILRAKLGKAFHYQSKEKLIQFESPTPISPWGGSTGHTSKIDQLEFPAGLSPVSALQFPLPVLMHYLNQRNILQQTFSWKTERLVQLSAKLDDVVELDKYPGLQRIGKFVDKSKPVAAGIGIGVGASGAISHLRRRRHNKKQTDA